MKLTHLGEVSNHRQNTAQSAIVHILFDIFHPNLIAGACETEVDYGREDGMNLRADSKCVEPVEVIRSCHQPSCNSNIKGNQQLPEGEG